MLPYSQEDVIYAFSRIKDSYVIHKGKMVEVVSTSDLGVLDIRCYEKNGSTTTGKARLSELDVNPPSLGYVNFGIHLNYLTRLPQRGFYRQGLHPHTVVSLCGLGWESIPSSYIEDAIFNRRPSFREACDLLNRQNIEAAWHKDWGVAMGNLVVYKGADVVGSVILNNSGSYSCILDPEYDYLQDELEESYARSNT